MVDINNEELLRFPSEAAKHVPGRPHVCSLWRWRTQGFKGVRLETVLVGGRRYTSKEAIQRFVEKTTAAVDGPSTRASTPARRKRELERAQRELEKAGL